jgi:hypothetical protein
MTTFADRIARRFQPDLGRRSFLSRTAMVGTALAVTPTSYLLRPGDAYSQVCPGPGSCPGGARCRGYTELCCSLYGENRCPAGTTMAGWWRADGSGFCGAGAPRYYMDCNGFGQPCTCWGCNCNNWKTSCTNFRYGNCNNHVPSVGPIRCRVISCTPPWQLDPGCSTDPRWDNNTRYHDRPCLHPPVLPPQETDAHAWAVTATGAIFGRNSAPYAGGANHLQLYRPIVGMARTPSGQGYWLVASDGGIFSFGDARFYGSMGGKHLNRPIVGMTATPSGRGYWCVASDGGIFTFGDAKFYGSTGNLRLNRPIVGMASTPSGRGYWLVASDGGIFTFGDAPFMGSGATEPTAAPVIGMARTSRTGYWIASADGTVRTFGTAPLLVGADPLPILTASVTSFCATTTGNGFLLVCGDGSMFPKGDAGDTYGSALPAPGTTFVGCASYT